MLPTILPTLAALLVSPRAPPARMMAGGLHELSAKRIDGSDMPFSSLEGKPTVMVNVASK